MSDSTKEDETRETESRRKRNGLALEESRQDLSGQSASSIATAEQSLAANQKAPQEGTVPSWHDLLLAVHPAPKDHTLLVLGVTAAVIVVIIGTAIARALPSVEPTFVTFKDPGAIATAQAQAWKDDVVAAQADAQTQSDETWRALAQRSTSPTPAIERIRRPTASGGKKAEAVVPSGPTIAPAVPPSVLVDPEFAAAFGSQERFEASNRHSSASKIADGATPAHSPSGRGTVLRATLKTRVATAAGGGPVIATLARAEDMRGHRVPAGTEIHGSITGGDENRAYLQFDLLRFADGSEIQFKGVAQDNAGRLGIPGKKQITSKTLGSVALEVGSQAAVESANGAGLVGRIVGRSIERGASAGAGKLSRLDRDEVVVVVDPGHSFTVYVDSVVS